MKHLPAGVRPLGNKIHIRWWVGGKAYTETLSLEPSPENFDYAARVRAKKIQMTKEGAYSKQANVVFFYGEPLDLNQAYSQMFIAARKRKSYQLTREDEAKIVELCGNRCAMTQIPFSLEKGSYGRRPFAPSLDRIDSAKGYTMDNVRIVCVATNLAMNEWGEWVFNVLARGYVASKVLPPDLKNMRFPPQRKSKNRE